jgi:hypothetical protein
VKDVFKPFMGTWCVFILISGFLFDGGLMLYLLLLCLLNFICLALAANVAAKFPGSKMVTGIVAAMIGVGICLGFSFKIMA